MNRQMKTRGRRKQKTQAMVEVGQPGNNEAWTKDSPDDDDDAHYAYKERSEKSK